MSTFDKRLAVIFTVLEVLDILGDFYYLLCFPHSSLIIVWILCFSIFFPPGLIIAAQGGLSKENGGGSLIYAIKMYLGLIVLEGNFN